MPLFINSDFATTLISVLSPGFLGDDDPDRTCFPERNLPNVPSFDLSLPPIPTLRRLLGTQSSGLLENFIPFLLEHADSCPAQAAHGPKKRPGRIPGVDAQHVKETAAI